MSIMQVGKRWRIRKTVDGKRYSFYTEYKPTKRDERILIEKSKDKVEKYNKSLYKCFLDYMELNEGSLSPSTRRGYYSIGNSLKDYELLNKDMNLIDKIDLQKFINEYSKTHMVKSTKNAVSLIKQVITYFREDFKAKIKLPQEIKKEPYIPTDNDIKLLLEYVKNTEYEIITRLLLNGLRMSELRGLTMANVGNGEITIDHAVVQGTNGWEEKSTKTQASTRTIKIDKKITDKIKKQGYIFKTNPNKISYIFKEFQDKYNIPHFSPHKCRHWYASTLINLKVPLPYVEKMGGWGRGSSVLREVYSHALLDVDYSKVYQDKIESLE